MKIRNFTNIKTTLFKNETVGQTIFKNTFWLALADGLSRLMAIVLFIYIARILGATEYGKFAFALSLIGLISILPNLVSYQIITRELSQKKEREGEYSAILSLKIILELGTVALILISTLFITPDPVIRKVIWILAIYNFLNSFDIVYAFLRARQRMEYESFAKIFQALIVTVFGFFVILNFPSVENLSYSYLLAALVTAISVLLFFHFKIYPLSLNFNKVIWQRMISFSWPLALIGVVTTIYTQTDTVMMGYLGQITQAGWYNVALKITRVALVPATLISQSFFPVLSRFFQESKEKLQKIWDFQIKIMILLAIPLMVGGIVLAPKIIGFIYDKGYDPAIPALQILIIMTGTIFLYDAFRQVLVVANQQKKFFWAVLAGAIINVVLNLILIPKFSLYGAAVATVITNILIFFLLIKLTLKFTTVNPFNFNNLLIFSGALLASGVMYLAITQSLIYQLHVVLSVLVGSIVYSATLFILRFGLKYFPQVSFKEK